MTTPLAYRTAVSDYFPGHNTIVANNLVTVSAGLSNRGSDQILFFFSTRLKLRNKLKELGIRWHHLRLNI